VLVVELELVALLSVAVGRQEPAARRLNQHPGREIGPDVDHGDRREGIRRVLLAPEHGQPELVNDGVPQLVETHEQHVADHELDHVHLLGLGHALEALIRAELAGAGGHLPS
jgi:hypothetical protein